MNADEKTSSFFEKLSFLNQTDKQKEEIAEQIIQENNPGSLYWIELILSTLIASLGLLQNSVAVIIGAMLIAPLIRPMLGMSFSMATGTSGFFWKSTFFLLKSIVVAIGISYVFAFLIPLKTETPEIIARITPNILDLFIAIFSAVIAFLSLGFERLSRSLVGVAMAASLIPPLAVVGIELSLQNFVAAWGSFLLFFVNLLAILFVGVIIFFLYGFTPHQELQKKISIRKIITLCVIILFTSIPLYSSLSAISLRIETEKKAHEFLSTLIPLKIPQAHLKDIEVLEAKDDLIRLKGVIQVPETTKIFQTTYNSILQETEEYFEKSMDIEFEMIRTANLLSPDIHAKEKEKILTSIQEIHSEVFSEFSALQQNISQTDENTWAIIYIISVPQGQFLTEEDKKTFIEKLQILYPENHFNFTWIAVAGSPKQEQQKQLSSEELIQKDIATTIAELLLQPEMKGVQIENITVKLSESHDIIFSARVLYPQKFPTPTPALPDSSSSMLSFSNSEVLSQILSSLNSDEKNTQTFSIESNDMNVEITPHWLGQKISQALYALPYKNITIDCNYFPYYNEVLQL